MAEIQPQQVAATIASLIPGGQFVAPLMGLLGDSPNQQPFNVASIATDEGSGQTFLAVGNEHMDFDEFGNLLSSSEFDGFGNLNAGVGGSEVAFGGYMPPDDITGPQSGVGVSDILSLLSKAAGVGGDLTKAFSNIATPLQPLINTGMTAYAADKVYQGTKETNEQNAALAREAMGFTAGQTQLQRDFNQSEALRAQTFNERQAQLNRDFQERMSNTSYQRAMADMARSGLNPMLAFRQGGASSPLGASASGIAATSGAGSGIAPTAQNATAAALNSGMQMASLISTLQQQEAQTEKTRAETRTLEAELERILPKREANMAADTLLKNAHELLAKQQEVTSSFEAGNLAERSRTEVQRRNEMAGHIALMKEQTEHELVKKGLTSTEAKLAAEKLPAAINAAYAQREYGAYFKNFHPFVQDISSLGHTAADLVRGFVDFLNPTKYFQQVTPRTPRPYVR